MPSLTIPRTRFGSTASTAAVGGGVLVLVLGLATARGGYFPVAWGWTTIALLSVAGVRLVVGRVTALAGRELLALGALGGLLVWMLVSIAWSDGAAQPMLEAERALLYVAALGVMLLLAERWQVPAVLGGLLAAVTAACGYGLATRLFPDRLGTFDSVAVYRLAEPVGYWNALGVLAAMASLLALGFVAQGRNAVPRLLAAASLVVLVPTLYFTFSRGAWLALAVGLLVTLAVAPARLRLLGALLAAAPAPVAAVALASRAEALTTRGAPLEQAAAEGHDLALLLPALALLAVVLTGLLVLSERLRGRAQAALAVGLAVVSLGGAVVAVTSAGGSGGSGPGLNGRLFRLTTNGRSDMWTVALGAYERHPVVGTGAGSFERTWLRERTFTLKVRDAHSLYVEVLGELGPVGLGLVLLALGIPLAAARRARAAPLVPACAGAYAAFVAHAGVDWDWELPAVTVTGLLCGGALLLAARRPLDLRRLPRRTATGVVLLALVAAFVAFTGNTALEASRQAARAGAWPEAAEQARRAVRWAPWSTEARRALGHAQLGAGETAGARASFRRAVAQDPGDWATWFDLARATSGDESFIALARAEERNPLAVEVARFRALEGDPGEQFNQVEIP